MNPHSFRIKGLREVQDQTSPLSHIRPLLQNASIRLISSELYDSKLVQLEEFETMHNITKFVESKLAEEQRKREEIGNATDDQLWEKIPEFVHKVAKETMGISI